MIVLKTLGEKLEYYSSSMLRIGLSIVYLWFGITQILNPSQFTQYIPDFIRAIIDNSELIILLSGIIITILGTLLLLGILTRIIAWTIALYTIITLTGIGYNDYGIKTFGILIGIMTIAMTRNDSLRLDNKIRIGKKKDPISFD